jgi:predicted NAD-dependent protein-ADP-ribosyltransferase YbiA (DUF1768 family)
MLENYGFVELTAEEAHSLGLPNSSGLFGELFQYMESEIRQHPQKKYDYKNSSEMTTEEKTISFMNRYFVFKKVRNVDAESMAKTLSKSTHFDEDANMGENEEVETEKTIVVKHRKSRKLKVPKITIDKYEPISVVEHTHSNTVLKDPLDRETSPRITVKKPNMSVAEDEIQPSMKESKTQQEENEAEYLVLPPPPPPPSVTNERNTGANSAGHDRILLSATKENEKEKKPRKEGKRKPKEGEKLITPKKKKPKNPETPTKKDEDKQPDTHKMTTPDKTTHPDKLCYYSKSANVKVGKGANEYVSDFTKYSELDKIPNWRRILSNFYVEPFTFKGKTYNSVEHAFQGYKIGTVDKEKGEYFTLESNHPIGKGDGSVAQKNRKLILFNAEQLAHWDSIKHKVMTEITYQRIAQSKTYRNVLLLTNNAELWHVMARRGIIRNVYLEELRDKFASKKKQSP